VNSAMIALLRDVGATEVPPPEGGVVDVEFRFKDAPPSSAAAVSASSPGPASVSRPERPQPER